jgi:hypothetical protein
LREFHLNIGMPAGSALITRKQLRPDEEARALAAMLARGYSEDGALPTDQAPAPGMARRRR